MSADPAKPANLLGTRFEQVLRPIEEQLQLTLKTARAMTDHNLSVGEQVEAALRATLRRFVPGGFGVGHGKVYDAYGDSTNETDLVITNPDHPFSFPDDDRGWYIIDGVAGVGEVKSVLTVDAIADCIKKASRYKRLRPTFNAVDSIEGGDAQLAYARQIGGVPPFIVVAVENQVALPTLQQRLAEAALVSPPSGKAFDNDIGNEPQPSIDALCVLGQGIAWNLRPADLFSATNTATGERVLGWQWIDTDAPLAHMLGWLHLMMPRVRRVVSPLNTYFIPVQRHLDYMETRDSFEVEEDDEESRSPANKQS